MGIDCTDGAPDFQRPDAAEQDRRFTAAKKDGDYGDDGDAATPASSEGEGDGRRPKTTAAAADEGDAAAIIDANYGDAAAQENTESGGGRRRLTCTPRLLIIRFKR